MLFFSLLRLSLLGSLLAAALLLLRPILRKYVPHAVSYYLWLIVLLRLCIPVGLTLPLPDQTAAPPAEMNITAPIQNNTNATPVLPLPPSEPAEAGNTVPSAAAAGTPQINVKGLLLLLWAVGAAICAVRYIGGYRRFVKHIMSGAREVPSQISALWDTLPHSPRIRLLCSATAHTPMLIGVIHPTVVLPCSITDTVMLHDILCHELVHARRGDVLYKWFTAAVTSIHWFNPLMPAIRREIGRTCELSCDAAVLRQADTAARRQYGETLLILADTPCSESLAAMLCEEKSSLKERLVSIVKQKKVTPAALLLSLLLILALGGCALIGNAEKVPPSTLNTDALIEDVTLYDLAGKSVAIPNAILDELYVKTQIDPDAAASISVHEKKSYDDMLADYDIEGGGFLFAIDRLNQAQYEEYITYEPAGSSAFARDDEYYYLWVVATDVQFYRSDMETYTEESMLPWNDLFAKTDEIKEDFIVRNHLTPYSDSEFYNRDFVYEGEHLYVRYRDERYNFTKILTLSHPVKQNGGIWCVESWRDVVGDVSYDLMYSFPGKGERSAEEVYTELQKRADILHYPYLLDPIQTAADWLNNDYFEGTDVTVTLDQLSIIEGTPGGNVFRRTASIWSQPGTLELLDAGGSVEQTVAIRQDENYNPWYNAASQAFGSTVWMKGEHPRPTGRALRYTAESSNHLVLYESGYLCLSAEDGTEQWFYAAQGNPYASLRNETEWKALVMSFP